MSYTEFPNVLHRREHFEDLIKVFEELRDNYAGTLKEIKDLSVRLDEYENNVTSRIDARIEQALTEYKTTVENTWQEKFNKHRIETTNAINEISAKVDSMEKTMRAFTLKTERDMDDFIDDINKRMISHVANVASMLSSMENSMENRQNSFETEVNAKLAELVINLPLEVESIKWLWYNVLKIGGMTVYEWYHYPQITCDKWNASEITCLEWYTNSKELLHWNKHREKLFSPISGDFTSLRNIVIELVHKLQTNAMTAGEFDRQQYTAQEIDEIRMLAGDYDWLGGLIYTRSTVERDRRVE